MFVKMIDAIQTPQTISLAESREVNGKTIVVYKPKRFLAGKKYEVPDDKVFIESLKKATRRTPYKTETEEALKKCGAEYEIVTCKACGGRVKKIEYHIFEVGA